MANEGVTKAVVVTAPASSAVQNSSALKLALYNADGTVASTFKKQPAIANSAAVDIAGVNTKINEILAALRAAGVIAT
jgi:hypothetical protein